ncbi:MAG: HAD family hydrolase [Bdellovibrionales bacterium]
MEPLSQFREPGTRVLLTDIDGTLTHSGHLPAKSYERMEALAQTKVDVIPVTGRPAGWCELIARQWPVHGVIGENGAFYFRHDGEKMIRHFVRSREQRRKDRVRLREIRRQVLREVPGARVASDQFCRLFDLAIDFAEDVGPLSDQEVNRIVKVFSDHGAKAKVSNIHVNGWYGEYDKVSTTFEYLKREFGWSRAEAQKTCAFVGDSPNDEPMFASFERSFAVANIEPFLDRLKHKPTYVSKGEEADGFCELVDRLLVLQSR